MKVGFFVTCLVDLMRPDVGFAAIELLERGGCDVAVPQTQTCCGQPAWNSGDAASAVPIVRQVITAFASYDYVVVPSGSCAGMIRTHYPDLFENDIKWQQKARDLANRTWELTSFLTEVVDLKLQPASTSEKVTYHDSCSGLRELGVHDQPRRLISMLENTQIVELEDSDVCCGFGGTFCVKYPEISTRIADEKIANVEKTGVDVLLGGDLGCLLHIAGRMRRKGLDTRVYHIAEWLAGYNQGTGIAQAEKEE